MPQNRANGMESRVQVDRNVPARTGGGQRRNSLLHSLNSVEFLDGVERRMPDRRWEEENAECSSRVSPVGNHRVFTMFGSMLRMRKRCRYKWEGITGRFTQRSLPQQCWSSDMPGGPTESTVSSFKR